MDMTALALITGLGWTSGIRFYAVLFALGLAHRSGFYALPASLELLAHPWVLTVSGLLCLVEFFADKIPGVDTFWDGINTFIRIPGGAILAAALLGGTIAAGAHLTKAGSRALINLSPEPLSNWTASLTEDALTIVALWTFLKYPLAFLGLLALFLLIALLLLPKLWRGVRRVVAVISRSPGRG
jgi:hypothetical protein